MGDGFSVRARLQSFRYAGRGLRALLSSQHNAWIHAVATIVAVLLGFLLGIGSVEWAAVVLAISALLSGASPDAGRTNPYATWR